MVKQGFAPLHRNETLTCPSDDTEPRKNAHFAEIGAKWLPPTHLLTVHVKHQHEHGKKPAHHAEHGDQFKIGGDLAAAFRIVPVFAAQGLQFQKARQ